jgi:hypothetical protein
MLELNESSDMVLDKMALGFSQESASSRAPCTPTQFICCFVLLKEQKKTFP